MPFCDRRDRGEAGDAGDTGGVGDAGSLRGLGGSEIVRVRLCLSRRAGGDSSWTTSSSGIANVTKHRTSGRCALLSSTSSGPSVGPGAYPSPASVGARARPMGTSRPAWEVRRARGEPEGSVPLALVLASPPSSVSSWIPTPVIWRMRGCC